MALQEEVTHTDHGTGRPPLSHSPSFRRPGACRRRRSAGAGLGQGGASGVGAGRALPIHGGAGAVYGAGAPPGWGRRPAMSGQSLATARTTDVARNDKVTGMGCDRPPQAERQTAMVRAMQLFLGIAVLLFACAAAAQKPIVYPAKGQSPQQQSHLDGRRGVRRMAWAGRCLPLGVRGGGRLCHRPA